MVDPVWSDPPPPVHDVTVVVPVHERPAQLDRLLTTLARLDPEVGASSSSTTPPAAPVDGGGRAARRAAGASPASTAGRPPPATPACARCGRRTSRSATPTSCPPGLAATPAPAPRRPARRPGRPAGAGPRGRSRGRRAGALRAGALLARPRAGARAGAAATPVSYVPSACLVGRVAALGEGFEESLRVAEDVDLVWRLVGGRVDRALRARGPGAPRAPHLARLVALAQGVLRHRGRAAGPASRRRGRADGAGALGRVRQRRAAGPAPLVGARRGGRHRPRDVPPPEPGRAQPAPDPTGCRPRRARRGRRAGPDLAVAGAPPLAARRRCRPRLAARPSGAAAGRAGRRRPRPGPPGGGAGLADLDGAAPTRRRGVRRGRVARCAGRPLCAGAAAEARPVPATGSRPGQRPPSGATTSPDSSQTQTGSGPPRSGEM